MSRRRATLEQIAFGEGTTPTERLRALELLREIEPVERPSEADRALRLALEVATERGPAADEKERAPLPVHSG